MDSLEAMMRRLQDIEKFCDKWPPPKLATNDDFMHLAIEGANHCNFLLRRGALLVSNAHEAERGWGKRRAIVAGHLVRVGKLYDAMINHASRTEGDICIIFQRLIIETLTRMEYLMKARKDTFKGFVLMSYRPEKGMLEDLSQKASARALVPIEKRMLSSVKRHLREDGISIAELNANRRWALDGKDFKQLLADIGNSTGYAYGFGIGSHWVHGDWFDIKRHHVKKSGGRYRPRLEQHVPDPRLVCPITIICLTVLTRFMKWNRADRDRVILPTIERLLAVTFKLEEEHERWIQVQP